MDLNQITLPARNMQQSVGFYKQLGFQQIVGSEHYARFVSDNKTTFSLHHREKIPSGNGVVVYFECKDLDKTVKQLKDKGVEFVQDPKYENWLWREARLHDPSGNELCLYWAGENRLNPPWRLD